MSEDKKIKNGLVIDEHGNKIWYKNGKYHRDNDLPAIEYNNGTKEWWVNGERHREDGPAITFKVVIESPSFNDDSECVVNYIQGWYINNIELSESDYLEYKIRKKNYDILNNALPKKNIATKNIKKI